MIRFNAQSIKVMEAVFDFRTCFNVKAEALEDFFDTLNGSGYRMQGTCFYGSSGKGNINTFGSKTLAQAWR